MFEPPTGARALRVALASVLITAVSSAHVTLDSPNGGEVLSVGQVFRVEWHIAIAHDQENWDLAYSLTGIGGPWIPIADNLPPGSTAEGSMHSFDWTVPDTPSTQVRVRVIMDNPEPEVDYFGFSSFDLEIEGCAEPLNYCVGAPNSAGAGARMDWTGTASLAANLFRISVRDAPAGKPTLFFYGGAAVSAPFGDGRRCVGSGSVGSVRLHPPLVTDGAGTATRLLDLTLLRGASGAGSAQAGDVLYLQAWYRDPAGGPVGFNLSDGLEVLICD